MRIRAKDCHVCGEAKDVLYRCQYDHAQDWRFACGKCLLIIKEKHHSTYNYGGTWKSKKK